MIRAVSGRIVLSGAPSSNALGHAAVFGMTEVLDVLVSAGARITSLEMAAAADNGRAASVRRLLAHGADPDLRDPKHHRIPPEDCQPGTVTSTAQHMTRSTPS